MMLAILLLFSFGGTVYPERSEGHTCAASIFSAFFISHRWHWFTQKINLWSSV